MYHTENTNYIGWSMHALTMAQGGPARGSPKLRPQAFKLDRSLDLGYSRIKKKEKRTYAQLNASRPRTVGTTDKIIQHVVGTGAHGPGSQAFEPTHTINQSTSQGLKLQARGHKLQDSGTRVQAHKLRVRGASNQDK